MRFGSLRMIIIAAAVLAQVYLFFRIRRAIKFSRRSERFTSLAVALVGATIGLLFALNWQILYRPIPWVDPPLALQALLFYAPAVWSLGSIFSALFLFIFQTVGWLLGVAVKGYRALTGRAGPDPVNISRRRFLRRYFSPALWRK